jgi:hypothetical protein
MDKAIVAAAVERLEAEKQRRQDEKIARGEAVLVPHPCVVLGVATDEQAAAEVANMKAREVARLRKAGEMREIVFDEPPDKVTVIITGVPRCGADESFPVEAIAKEGILRVEDFGARRRASEALNAVDRPMPSTPAPVSAEEPTEPLDVHRIYVQTAPPTDNDPGAIVEGSYSVYHGTVRVYDADGHLLGVEHTDANAGAVARRVLRAKKGPSDFWRTLH